MSHHRSTRHGHTQHVASGTSDEIIFVSVDTNTSTLTTIRELTCAHLAFANTAVLYRRTRTHGDTVIGHVRGGSQANYRPLLGRGLGSGSVPASGSLLSAELIRSFVIAGNHNRVFFASP